MKVPNCGRGNNPGVRARFAYVLSFDDPKLPLNVLVGRLVFDDAKPVAAWAMLIHGASLFIMLVKMPRKRSTA